METKYSFPFTIPMYQTPFKGFNPIPSMFLKIEKISKN